MAPSSPLAAGTPAAERLTCVVDVEAVRPAARPPIEGIRAWSASEWLREANQRTWVDPDDVLDFYFALASSRPLSSEAKPRAVCASAPKAAKHERHRARQLQELNGVL